MKKYFLLHLLLLFPRMASLHATQNPFPFDEDTISDTSYPPIGRDLLSRPPSPIFSMQGFPHSGTPCLAGSGTHAFGDDFSIYSGPLDSFPLPMLPIQGSNTNEQLPNNDLPMPSNPLGTPPPSNLSEGLPALDFEMNESSGIHGDNVSMFGDPFATTSSVLPMELPNSNGSGNFSGISGSNGDNLSMFGDLFAMPSSISCMGLPNQNRDRNGMASIHGDNLSIFSDPFATTSSILPMQSLNDNGNLSGISGSSGDNVSMFGDLFNVPNLNLMHNLGDFQSLETFSNKPWEEDPLTFQDLDRLPPPLCSLIQPSNNNQRSVEDSLDLSAASIETHESMSSVPPKANQAKGKQRKGCKQVLHVCLHNHCGAAFPSQTKLEVHCKDQKHKGFQCLEDGCGVGFSQKGNLVRHRKKHNGEKIHQCQFCPKRFRRKANLKDHERTHTKEKPFACAFCSKRFSQKGHRKSHERTHTGEKPFVCGFCPKRFAHKSNLRPHERTHTGEKPFSCTFCPKRFAHKSGLRAHERTHTGEKPFACAFCPKRFTRKYILGKHIKKKHA